MVSSQWTDSSALFVDDAEFRDELGAGSGAARSDVVGAD
jgi:hypothetical protein